jgi:NADPH:quinone reductase-like Zn-dependent oxidoreductase
VTEVSIPRQPPLARSSIAQPQGQARVLAQQPPDHLDSPPALAQGPLERMPETIRGAVDDLIQLYRSRGVRPLIRHTFPLADAPAALDAIASRQTIGKPVVLHGS